jgi:hypothetical protein
LREQEQPVSLALALSEGMGRSSGPGTVTPMEDADFLSAQEPDEPDQPPRCENCKGSGYDPRRDRWNIGGHQPCPVCGGTGENVDIGLRHQRQKRP